MELGLLQLRLCLRRNPVALPGSQHVWAQGPDWTSKSAPRIGPGHRARSAPGSDTRPSQPPGSDTGLSPPAQHGPGGQKRQQQTCNVIQLAALSLEAEKAARGETLASNQDIAAQISELGGGRVVIAPNWFRNQSRKRQRAATVTSGDAAGANHDAP